MNRRGFMKRLLGAIVAPAFVQAASLWLPKERPPVFDEDALMREIMDECRRQNEIFLMYGEQSLFQPPPHLIITGICNATREITVDTVYPGEESNNGPSLSRPPVLRGPSVRRAYSRRDLASIAVPSKVLTVAKQPLWHGFREA